MFFLVTTRVSFVARDPWQPRDKFNTRHSQTVVKPPRSPSRKRGKRVAPFMLKQTDYIMGTDGVSLL